MNEGGGGELKRGKAVANDVQAAEKVYYSVSLEVRNAGGHSSLPRKDNAIYRLAAGLTRLAAYEFPVQLNDVTRGYFARMASLETGQVALDMKAVASPTPDASSCTASRGPCLRKGDCHHFLVPDPGDSKASHRRKG